MAERAKKQVVDDGYRLPDHVWERIEPLIPAGKPHPLGCHKPRVPNRDVMDAILLVLRTGMQWKALDLYGPCKGSVAHKRFQEWVQAGVFLKLWQEGLRVYDEEVGIDWEWLSMDGAMTKAPLGGEKGGPEPYRSRQRRRQAKRPVRRKRTAPRTGD